jgi:pimeloyl-ACP methyl ester carboxylesterase
MTPATVVLVNGTGGSPAMWSRVIPRLDELGVPNVAVQLPSGLPESAIDDAASVRSLLDELVGPVVLVGHSGGGMVLTEVGAHSQVKHLVYVDALMLDAGDNQFALTAGEFAEAFVACMPAQDEVFAWDTDAFAAYFVGRGWPATDAQEFVLGCRPQRAAASVLENTQAAWRSVPSTFVSCDDSEMSAELRALFGSRATDVIEMPGDHFPIWLRPDEVAQILARIAGEVADE